jgi:hypothetical protein
MLRGLLQGVGRISIAKERYWISATALCGCSALLPLPVTIQACAGVVSAYTLLDRINIIEISLISDHRQREQSLCKLLEEQLLSCRDLTGDVGKDTFFVGLPVIRYADEGLLGYLWEKTIGVKRWTWQYDFYMQVRYVDKRYGTNGEVSAEGVYVSASEFRFTYIEVTQIAPARKRVIIKPEEIIEV